MEGLTGFKVGNGRRKKGRRKKMYSYIHGIALIV
jgi:hypothetical protein